MKTFCILALVFFLCLSLFTNAQNTNTDRDIMNNSAPSSDGATTPPSSTPNPAPPVLTTEPRVRVIRSHIPPSCPMRVLPNYEITFTYTAHLVTVNNTVGEKFDGTDDFSVLTLAANKRHMLEPLLQGMLGACIDEKRMVVIPHQLSTYTTTDSVPPKTDTVFILTIIDIEPAEDLFDAIDTTYDNCITKDELTEYLLHRQEFHTADGSRPLLNVDIPEYLIPQLVNRYFDEFDKNQDGVLECDELNTKDKQCAGLSECPIAAKERERKLQILLKQQREALLKKMEEDRIAAEKKAEEDRIAAEKKAEEDRIAAEKKAEEERIAAEKKAEEDKKREEEEKLRAASGID